MNSNRYEYAKKQLDEYVELGHISSYKLSQEAGGRLAVSVELTFDPEERCLRVLRLTEPGTTPDKPEPKKFHGEFR